jgi:hypothetical protein
MQSIEKRIAALEAARPVDPFRAFRLEVGEPEQAARRRCGIPAEAVNVLFIGRVIISPRKVQYAEH